MTRARRVTRWLLELAFLALVIGVVTVAGLAHLLPAVDHPVFIIRSGSMVPAIPVGAAVILDAGSSRVESGDVVTLRLDNGEAFTHRVTRLVSLGGAAYVETKGDANPNNDPALTPVDHVVGRVAVSLPVAGFLIAGLATPAGLIAALLAALALVAALWLIDEGGCSAEPSRVIAATPEPTGSRRGDVITGSVPRAG